MDIYEYRDEVIDKLDNMSDKEFVDLLNKAGVKCELVDEDKEEKEVNNWKLKKKNKINMLI